MTMDIATGAAQAHEPLLPYSPENSPATAPPTPVASAPSPANQGTVRDLTGERLGQLAQAEADIRAAQASGFRAENGRRSGYAADISPAGAAYGDQPALPVVPEDAVTPSSGFLYGQGDQPGA
jgi:hypothetical protein